MYLRLATRRLFFFSGSTRSLKVRKITGKGRRVKGRYQNLNPFPVVKHVLSKEENLERRGVFVVISIHVRVTTTDSFSTT